MRILGRGFLCFFVCLVGWEFSLRAQDLPSQDINLDEFILKLFPVQDEDINYEDIYENLFQRYRTPLNLNKASRDEISSLFILSELQINSLLQYREENGTLLSLFELQAVPNFDPNTIENLLPFVTVQENPSQPQSLFKRVTSEKNNYLLLRYRRILEERRGFTSDATPSQTYQGSPGNIYARFRVSHSKDFSLGFTLEKDDGEEITWDRNTYRYGADFSSFHAYFENKGAFKAIALGDYQLQIGQGLLFSSGFSVGKGSETVQTVRRSNLGLRPYTSVLETGFLRGAGLTYQAGPLDITAFYSRIRRDASITEPNDTLDSEVELFIETLRTSGLHRTETEIEGKSRFLEQTLGGDLTYNSPSRDFRIGLTFIRTEYDLPFQRNNTNTRDSIRNQFEFSGTTNYNTGLHFNYNWRNFSFFGEAARSKSGGLGGVGGFVSSLAPNVELAMVYRYYQKDFHTFFGNAFGEGTRNINERGIYWGLKITPIQKKLILAAYYDRFVFPWLRSNVDAPSEGYEFLSRATYKFSRRVSLYAQYRQEAKDRNLSGNESQGAFREIRQGLRRNYLINFNYRGEKVMRFRSRVQFSSFDFNGERTRGYALVQDVGADIGKFQLDFRIALFDTDDFDNRQYVYEKDVLWSFSIPAYSGRGVRTYFLVRYKINGHWDVWLRYARTDLENQDTIGSGGDEINGSTRSDVRAQIRIKF